MASADAEDCAGEPLSLLGSEEEVEGGSAGEEEEAEEEEEREAAVAAVEALVCPEAALEVLLAVAETAVGVAEALDGVLPLKRRADAFSAVAAVVAERGALPLACLDCKWACRADCCCRRRSELKALS